MKGTKAAVGLAFGATLGLALVAAGVWLAAGMPYGLVAAGITVLLVSALLFLEV